MAENEFLGTGWGFPPQFIQNGKQVRLVSGEDDVRESLEILFSTSLSERYNYEQFGCDMKRFMFQEVTPALIIEIRDMIIDAVTAYEPRITLRNIEIDESEDDAKLLLINIGYNINATNTDDNMVYPLYIF
jgi:uncharacterized protein